MTLLTSRRHTHRQTEASQLFVVFPIQLEWFALPIPMVQKVVPLAQVYGTSAETGMGLTHCQDQEIVVIDAGRRIFGRSHAQKLLPMANPESTEQPKPKPINPLHSHRLQLSAYSQGELNVHPYLLILQTSLEHPIGLPLNALPILRRVTASAFAPLPAVYATQGSIRCVNALITLEPDQPPIFLIDLEQLLQWTQD
jgi:purine-binding chemotaxis protein CheW